MMDVYQDRYLKHRERKHQALMSTAGTTDFYVYSGYERDIFEHICLNRRSQRTFNRADIDVSAVLRMLETVPSSCDRRGVYTKTIADRDDKDLLGGLLVGGVGWIHHAHTVLLLFADMAAYKGIAEGPMPYLDAGVMVQMAYLAAEVNNIGCCRVAVSRYRLAELSPAIPGVHERVQVQSD